MPRPKKIKPIITDNTINTNNNTDTINNICINDTSFNNIDTNVKIPKKRGRKSNKLLNEINQNNQSNQSNENITDDNNVKIPKKRGRKPKGGKIVNNIENKSINNNILPNVIIHFKCSIKDIISGIKNNSYKTIDEINMDNYNNSENDEVIPNESMHYNINNNKLNELGYSLTENDYNNSNNSPNNNINNNINTNNDNDNTNNNTNNNSNNTNISNENNNVDYKKDNNNNNLEQNNYIWRKIKELEVQLHNNSLNGKRSACFWDTCSFDTPMFFIPKYMDGETIKCYGCFCSIPCALAYLENEDIDSSTKYERRQLLYHIYQEFLNQPNDVIQPAPNPRYTLDKFLGNLSIQEWRLLLKSNRLLLIVDKPLTPELPELHLDNSDRYLGQNPFSTEQYGKYKIRKIVPKQNKSDIISEKFGNIKK